MSPLLWLLLLAPAGPLLMTGLNALTWPRRRRGGAVGRVSVLIPARDEQARIAACVEAALALDPPALEVVVYDDGSTDQTPTILADLQTIRERKGCRDLQSKRRIRAYRAEIGKL